MSGIFTRPALDKIMTNANLTQEQRTEQIFALYGRALDDGFISRSAAEEAKQAAIEATKASFKAPDPIDPTTTKEYMEIARERDMLRAIGGEDFAEVKPKFRETVFWMLDRGEKAKPIKDQMTGIREKYEEYFTANQQQEQKPQFGAPIQGAMPKGDESVSARFQNAWGYGPRKG